MRTNKDGGFGGVPEASNPIRHPKDMDLASINEMSNAACLANIDRCRLVFGSY
jgi:hypothetical protein